jgi:hypothetical protein
MRIRSEAPLPDDPRIASLDDEARSGIAAAWRRKATNELTNSTVFASLTRSLIGLRAPHEIVRCAAIAVADEVRHAEICVHVARAYLPSGAPPDPSPVIAEPAPSADPELGAVLFTVMQSCLNEGVATVYLQRCLSESRFVLARAAIRAFLEDEIHHARIGWSLLASEVIGPSLRSAVAEALPTLLERVAEAWLANDESPLAPIPPGHGTLEKDAMPDVVRTAVEDLLLPGFDAVGIDSTRARIWTAKTRSL